MIKCSSNHVWCRKCPISLMCPNQLPDIPDVSNSFCRKNCYKEHASTKSDTVLAGGSSSRFPKLGFRYAVKTWGFKQTSTYTRSYKAVFVSCAVASEQVAAFTSRSSSAGSSQGISSLASPRLSMGANHNTLVWGEDWLGDLGGCWCIEILFFCEEGGREGLSLLAKV